MSYKGIHPEERGLFRAWLQATQGEEQSVSTPEERFYLQYNPGDDCWEVWERTHEGEHDLLASFYDGTKERSPLAELNIIMLGAMQAAAEEEATRERRYIPLKPEEKEVEDKEF